MFLWICVCAVLDNLSDLLHAIITTCYHEIEYFSFIFCEESFSLLKKIKKRYKFQLPFQDFLQQISEALRLLCQLLTEDLSGYAERVSFDRLAIYYFESWYFNNLSHISMMIIYALSNVISCRSQEIYKWNNYFRFAEIYKFLANLGGIPNAQVELALKYLKEES